ncbi:MAG: DinB family protein [Desulfovibrio sp.]|nr:DinB family protein [Desulfovibrio sp.]
MPTHALLPAARRIVADMQALLDSTPLAAAHVRVAADAWTLGEIVGHLIDSASNNHQRFARLRLGNLDGFPGYKAEAWVLAQDYAACDFPMLAGLWTQYNALLLHLAATTPAAALGHVWRRPDHAGGPLTLEFLVADYYDHLRLHCQHYGDRLAEVLALQEQPD